MITRERWLLLIAWLMVVSIGCDSTGDRGRFELMSEDGVEVAYTLGGPLYEGDLFTFEKVVELNQDPDNVESLVFRVRVVVEGPDGCFYVPDWGGGRIAVFGPDGEYQRSFGRQGAGPGEFRNMVFQSLQGDVLSLRDRRNNRTTIYRTDGTLLDILSPTVGLYTLQYDRIPGGIILQRWFEDEEREDTGHLSYCLSLSREADGDTFAVLRTPMVPTVFTDQDLAIEMPMPYAGSPYAWWTPGQGILLVDGYEPVLYRYDLRGNLTLKILPGIELPPVTDALKRSFEARIPVLTWQADPDWNHPGRFQPRYPKYPVHVGLCDHAVLDDAGFIWLLDVLDRYKRQEGEGYLYHVIDPEGRYLGRARLPVEKPRISFGHLTGIQEDPETGEQHLVVYSINSVIDAVSYPQ
ncbi:hypothetical protein ACFL41_01440 [Gemmatimonadota bacterium]